MFVAGSPGKQDARIKIRNPTRGHVLSRTKNVAAPTERKSAAEWVPVRELRPWVRNPRKNDKAVKKIAKSIQDFGFGAPLIARRENGEVIGGHTRLKAAIFLGLEEVPVRYLDLDEKQAHQLALADNKLGELADWDEEGLQKLLGEMSLAEADSAGWTLKELGKMAEDEEKELDPSPKLKGVLKYQVLIECDNELQQTELLDRFDQEGLKCKPIIL